MVLTELASFNCRLDKYAGPNTCDMVTHQEKCVVHFKICMWPATMDPCHREVMCIAS